MAEVRYKVVREKEGKLYSALIMDWGVTEYKVGEWIQAPELFRKYGYYLYVFKEFKNAIAFINEAFTDKDDLRIYKCFVRGKHKIVRIPPALDIWNYESKGILTEMLYVNSSLPYRLMERRGFPLYEGTETWEYVKVIEEVSYEI